jgi:type IX secretion system PorP/SprF family membrane protein
MKSYYLAGSFLVFSITCLAQQKPHYTQYVLNQYIINPALSGIENYTDIKLSHRHQWTGIDGAPVTTYFTMQGPIGKKDYRTTATSFEIPGENPRGHQYWENYTAAEPHHGAGLQIINDATGPLNNFSAYATYAYHIGISARTSLSAGIGAGISKFSLDASKLIFANTSVDPSVYSNGLINRSKFDMTAGLYLYSADYFVGVSAQQILSSQLDFSNNTVTSNGKTVPHIFATTGYRFLLNDDINFTPSLMVKYINPLPLLVETNLKFQYRDLLWLGAGYRYKDGLTAMAGLHVSNVFTLGYSYDYTTSGLNTYSKATHELVLGFTLGNKFGDTCPKNVW